MSKSDFEHVHGFLVDNVVPDVARVLEDDVIIIEIVGTVVTFTHHTDSVSAWDGATGTYDPVRDRIDGYLPHSADPMDGEHPYSITLDRGPLGGMKRPRIHVHVGARVGGPAVDDGSWSGSGNPPPRL